jgi:hypothetical protein
MVPEASDPTTATTMDYLLDEIRATSALLRVADLARTAPRPWWRNLFFGLVRTPTEVSADLGVQYLGENIDRARDHWREAISLAGELHRTFPTNEMVVALGEALDRAGLNEVIPLLQHDAIPRRVADAAVHLAAVVDKIRECDRLVAEARQRLLLQRAREPGSGT